VDDTNVEFVVNSLRQEGLAFDETAPDPNLPAGGELALTPAGWLRYGELKQSVVESRAAFMAMPFGEPDLDRLLAACVRPAVER
jgi:hypothetical protein